MWLAPQPACGTRDRVLSVPSGLGEGQEKFNSETYAGVGDGGRDGALVACDVNLLAAVAGGVVGAAEGHDVVTVGVDRAAGTSGAVLGVVGCCPSLELAYLLERCSDGKDREKEHVLAVPEPRVSRGAAMATEEARAMRGRSLNMMV